MSSDDYYSDESSGFSVGVENYTQDNRHQIGSDVPRSRDVGTQMKTHYVLEPQRFFSRVRDVGTQTIENANHVTCNPRILSNSYSEAVQLKKQEKEFSFVYDLHKDELYRIRIYSSSEDDSDESDSSTTYTVSSESEFANYSDFSYSINEFDDELGNTRTVGVQMSTKYLIQESRPKVVLRDVAIQTKLANVYGPSQSEMIEQLWRNKIPLSKNVTCSLPTFRGRQRSDVSASDTGYLSDFHHRSGQISNTPDLKLDSTHRQTQSARCVPKSFDRNTGTLASREGMQRNPYMFSRSVSNQSNSKFASESEQSAGSDNTQDRKWKSKRGSSKGCRRPSSERSSVSTTSSTSYTRGRSERKTEKTEENFELTTFEYLGENSSVRLKSEISSISTQTETEQRKGPKVFRNPSRRLESEQHSADFRSLMVHTGSSMHQPSDSESGIEFSYSPPQLTQEKGNLYTRDHSPTPIEPVVSSRYPYRPKEKSTYVDKVKDLQTNEKSQDESSQNSHWNTDDRPCSVEIGPEPNVLPAEFIEKPVIKPRVRKAKVFMLIRN